MNAINAALQNRNDLGGPRVSRDRTPRGVKART